ncbi:hypothetical protein AAHA92_13511 [Salvia divinorum]|uniref:Chlororespiratory reduction31 n=1 Tax=Salvia divinorum TaxID=28513 RepID=A0ABD1H8H5_SALDI
MAASFHLQTLHKSPFLLKPSPKPHLRITAAKFNLYEILGGRGLCNGEQGIQQELKKTISPAPPPTPPPPPPSEDAPQVSEEGFEKELLGLTGGFPGGEKGLKKFIQENPPPPPAKAEPSAFDRMSAKAKAPELPLLLPGMIAIVKSPRNPFHMYCGIVQRISDGKAGVLFEGGNWDKLVTFRLDELERRDKGPPMVNPRSAILELEESSS